MKKVAIRWRHKFTIGQYTTDFEQRRDNFDILKMDFDFYFTVKKSILKTSISM